MEYRCHIGYWEGKLFLSPDPADEHVFRDFGPLSTVVVDRTVVIAPDPDGNSMYEIDRERNGGIGFGYEFTVPLQPWARFVRHECEVTLDEDDGTSTWEVPADHLLPWPRLVSNTRFDATAVAQRELHIRGRSAFAADGEDGLIRTLRNVPERIRVLLWGETWSYTINLIKDGKELPC